jgi:hypothetical protein
MRPRVLQVAIWILLRLVPEGEREPLVGDLTEEYALRANAESSSRALKWCLRQVCASAPHLLLSGLARVGWMSTIGVALLAYLAVGVVEFIANWVMSRSFAHGVAAYNPLELLITVPMVVLIGYFAARFRRRAPAVLAAMMLLVVTAMTLWSAESMPLWYRITYFVVGPAAAIIGSSARARQSVRQRY